MEGHSSTVELLLGSGSKIHHQDMVRLGEEVLVRGCMRKLSVERHVTVCYYVL